VKFKQVKSKGAQIPAQVTENYFVVPLHFSGVLPNLGSSHT